MSKNHRLLSTKKFTEQQSELLLATGAAITHYDVLKIVPLKAQLQNVSLDHVIITSVNAAESLLEHKDRVQFVYTVGAKTTEQLQSMGLNVIETCHNAAQLAQAIIEKYSEYNFTYLCGVHRRDELPQALLSTQISFQEVKVYDSVAVEKSFDCIFDAVMFYSPRGVHAFAKANPQNLHLAICIGETTAKAARIYTQNVKVAKKATVENTIVTAVKALLND